MTGAIAGTAILNVKPNKGKLHTVTLTVNDYCNLDCSYCYLRAETNNHFVREDVLRRLEHSEFGHLAIVGKEPLASKNDTEKTLDIVRRFREKGISVSLITNGIGLKHIREAPTGLDYIDVSFDGGPETFKVREKISYQELKENIQRIGSYGVRFNALQTVYSQNLNQIGSMMAIREIEDINTILFSPYLDTRNYGQDGVSKAALNKLLEAFSDSRRFREDANSLSLIDRFHVEQDSIDFTQIKNQIRMYGLENKVRVIEEDPLSYGIVRVTHDGLVLTPKQSLHVRDYPNLRASHQEDSLEQVYQRMVA